MEIIKNRYGNERVYEFIAHDKVRVTGQSEFVRQSQNDNGEVIMYDFEGGPCFNKDANLKLKGLKMKIEKIEPVNGRHKNLSEVVLHVKP